MISPGDLALTPRANLLWDTPQLQGEANVVGSVKSMDLCLVLACAEQSCMILTPELRFGWLDYRLVTTDVDRTSGA